MSDPINLTITPPDEIVLNVLEGDTLELTIQEQAPINLTVNPNTVVNTVTIENTERILKRVWNNTGATLVKGRAVYVTGGHGSEDLTVAYADNASEATSSKTIGLVAEDIANNSQGYIVTQGFLEGFDTTALSTEGARLWLGKNGNLVITEAVSPDHLVFLGWVVKKGGQGVGSVYVLVQNGFELEEIHDVLITNPQEGEVIAYNSTSQLWENTPQSGGGGLTRSVPSFVGQGSYFHGRHMYGIAPSSTANFFTSHNGYLWLYPVVSQEDITIDAMKVYIATSNNLASFKILMYDSDDTTGKPVGTPLEESGTFGMNSAGIYTFVLPSNRTLDKGRQYWVGVNLAVLSSGGAIRGFSPVYSTSVWTDISTTLNYALLRVPQVVGAAPYDFTANPWTATNITTGSLGNAIPLVWMELV